MEDAKTKIANPAPLGLLSFGMTTVLLNLHNSEIIKLSIVIVAMGLCLGGFAQIIAGVFEMKQGNTFGGTAFIAYGSFWWSLVVIWVNPFDPSLKQDGASMGFYLMIWGIFSLVMFIGTLKHSVALRFTFITLTLLFFLLSAANFTGSGAVHLAAGIVGIICGSAALYTSFGLILKNEYGREILRLCEPKAK